MQWKIVKWAMLVLITMSNFTVSSGDFLAPTKNLPSSQNNDISKTPERNRLETNAEALKPAKVSGTPSFGPEERELSLSLATAPTPAKPERKLGRKRSKRKKRRAKKKKEKELKVGKSKFKLQSPPDLLKFGSITPKYDPLRLKNNRDIIDELPNPVPPEVLISKNGKMYRKPLKKHSKHKEYIKLWEEDKKKYPDVDKYQKMDKDLENMIDPTFGVPKQKTLRLRSVENDNPVFLIGFHADMEHDFFKLNFPKLLPGQQRLKQIKTNLLKWFRINPAQETIDVEYMTQNGHETKNYVVAKYFNNRYYRKKNYIIEIFFMNEKPPGNDLRQMAKFVNPVPTKNKYYEKNFLYTWKYKCNVIRKKMIRPKLFTCWPAINEDKFFIDDLFVVNAKLRDGRVFQDILFTYMGADYKKARPLYPEPIYAKTEPLPDAEKLIKRRYQTGLKRKYKFILHFIDADMAKKSLVTAFDQFKKDIDEYKLYYKTNVALGEQNYQEELKNQLWHFQKELYSKFETSKKNYEIFQQKVYYSNTYGLNLSLLRMREKLDTLNDMRTYVVKRRRFVLEEHIRRVIEFLNYVQYFREKLLERRIFEGRMA